MFHIFLILIVSYSFVFASDVNQDHYIDDTYLNVAEKVNYLSLGIDDFIVNRLDFFSKHDTNESNAKSTKIDTLFQNEKFTNETDKSYIKISTDYKYNSIGADSTNINISARLALNRTNKRLKLFINNFTEDNINKFVQKDNYAQNSPELGFSIIHNIRKNIESKYSLGIKSLYPFVRARFIYKTQVYGWKIEPLQSFEYSTKDEFKEYTRLYLDKELLSKTLFRVEFGRATSSASSGMDYHSSFHIFWIPTPKIGFELSQGFYGNTHYEYTTDGLIAEKRRFNGINNYSTQFSFRQNIFRKWFFYQLNPGVNFAKSNNYKANYSLYLKFDILIGKI